MKITKKYAVSQASKCLLCNNPPCSGYCPNKADAGKFIKSIRFENFLGAKKNLPDCENCIAENGKFPCETRCICDLGAVDIRGMAKYIKDNVPDIPDYETDLSIDFLGVHCENPFFLSSSVVASNYEMVAKAFDMGWGGAVWKTIGNFIPKEVSPRFDTIAKEDTPFVGFRNLEQISDHAPEENFKYISDLKKDYPNKVIIASIMGQNEEEWTYLARKCEEAGADIIECNFSCPQMAGEGMGSDVGQNPQLVKSYCQAVRRGTTLPVLAKMTPNISNIEVPAIAAMEGGADGLAAINTIKSLTSVDTKNFFVDGKTAVSGYSGKAVKPIALRFINDMAQCKELQGAALSGIGGIETYKDALEFILLGCENVQITTAVMQYGYSIIDDLIDGTMCYMQQNGIKKISDIVGAALKNVVAAEDLDRDTFCFPKFDREKCIGCGRCYISCYDGGHQAIGFSDDRTPHLNGSKCVGCHLCMHVCPVGAISSGKRVIKKVQR